jgi:cyclopropane fatty-acyl-phospholipid synthase-like methyltransferase
MRPHPHEELHLHTEAATPPERVTSLSHAPVANRGLEFRNPIDGRMVDEVLESLDLAPGARVLDIGCGSGEFLIRAARRYGAAGTGLDAAEASVAEARERAREKAPDGELDFRVQDARHLDGGAGGYEAAAAIGAGDAVGGYAEALARLAELVASGGRVVLGEAYWLREPSAEYVASLGIERSTLPTYDEMIRAGSEAGLLPRYAVASSLEVRDRYLWTRLLNCERHIAARPSDPLSGYLRRWADAERGRYVHLGGRDVLGFCLFVFTRQG